MKKIALVAILSVFFSTAILKAGFVVKAEGSTRVHVYPGDSIQEALNSAQSGDVIFVHEGTYYERIIVNKTVEIVGSDKEETVIDGNGTGTVVYVEQAMNASVSGFTVRNGGGYSDFSENYGIHLLNCRGCNISGNVIEENYYGLGLTFSTLSVVGSNILYENNDGIRLTGSTDNVICQNTLSRNLPGIGLRYSTGNRISNNTIKDGSYDPISLTYSSGENVVMGNSISNNTGSLYISSSDHNLIRGNSLAQNRYGGIQLFEAGGNIVAENNVTSSLEEDYGAVRLLNSEKNLITENNLNTSRIGVDLLFANDNLLFGNRVSQASYWGVGLSYSNNNSVVLNTVEECERAILMMVNASYGQDNKVFHNNFIGNINQTDLRGTNGNSWDNGVEGNYWSDYTGKDLNKDVVGDSPYMIDANNQDNYPLMGMISEFEVMDEEYVRSVTVVCNSPILEFKFDVSDNLVSLTTEEKNEVISARICFPKVMLNDSLRILINGHELITQEELPTTNSTHLFIYFTYGSPPNPFWKEWWFWTILISGTVITLSAVTFLQRRKTQVSHQEETEKSRVTSLTLLTTSCSN